VIIVPFKEMNLKISEIVWSPIKVPRETAIRRRESRKTIEVCVLLHWNHYQWPTEKDCYALATLTVVALQLINETAFGGENRQPYWYLNDGVADGTISCDQKLSWSKLI
jgi:hypothetical protein